MKVVIAIDDISLPLPPMRRPDVRERVLTVVLELLADHGVDDVEIIIATSVHRRMTGDEIRHVVGDKIFDAYWPNRLYNHDAEDPTSMKYVGTTEHGEVVELNRKRRRERPRHLREPEPRPDGRRAQVRRGRASAATRACARTTTRRRCATATRTWIRATSALATSVERMGRLANKTLNVFTIETTINNRMFDRPLEFLAQERGRPRPAASARRSRRCTFTLSKLPQPARQAIFQRVPSPYGVTGVFAGETRGGARADARALLRAVPRARSRARPTSSSRASRTSARTT